jgi:LysR family nod box-dependent transcriptional activator
MHLDRFNLNLFVALEAVLNSRNLTEAAKSVFLTQPAMSVALKKLRQHYGDELVIYAGGETELTSLGLALRPRVKELIQTAKDALKLTLDFDPADSTQIFRLVTTDILELIYMKDVLGDIAREAPHVTTIVNPFSYEPVEQLFRDNVDVAIVSEAFASEKFERAPLFSDTFTCVVWEGNSVVGGGDTITREQYFALNHASHSSMGPAAVQRVPEGGAHRSSSMFSEINSQRKVTVRTSTLSALPQVIIGTDLIVTMPARFAAFCLPNMPLKAFPVPVPTPTMTFVAQWQPYRSGEPALNWLLDKLKAVAARA